MQIEDLEKFGFFRQTFLGDGFVKLADGSQAEGKFAIAQRDDGQLFFKIDFTPPAWKILNDDDFIQELTGTLSDGRPANLNAPLFIKEISPPTLTKDGLIVTVIGYPSKCEFGKKQFNTSAVAIFDLVNCLFLGTEAEKVIDEKGQLKEAKPLMTINLGERQVELRQIPQYKQAESILRAQRGVQITCTAKTPIENFSKIDEVVSTIEALCYLMSIARGTLISWSSFNIFDSDDELPLYSVYLNTITRNYDGNALIRETPQHHTKTFLETGFVRYKKMDEDFQIRRITRAYVETRSGPFLETRAMLIGVLAEYLANVQARLEGRISLMRDEDFGQILPYIEDAIDTTVEKVFSAVSKKKRKKYKKVMLTKTRDFNRRPLDWKLDRLAKWLELELTDKEISNFITARDTLLHTARFPQKLQSAKYWEQMLHFLDRIMLRLFGYRGPYYDIEHNRMAQL
jgi:hypothetical protein